jgi:nucleotide-binding universal stress UspA family protein
MIKTILVLSDETPAFEATLSTAVELARTFEAHIDVLHVAADPVSLIPVTSAAVSAPMTVDIRKAAANGLAERASQARAVYEQVCGRDVVSSSWHAVTGSEPEVAAAAGRPRDLIVVGPPRDPDDSLARQTLHALLFDSGRPVLILPVTALSRFDGQIALAWNGTAQSARAAAAALPFLRLTERATVLSAGAVDPHASSAALMGSLARHGIQAVGREFEPSYKPIGQALLEQAHQVAARMLVMGAYGHSRLREIILGGATREVLRLADLPVLMAH